MTAPPGVVISEEVRGALDSNTPVVALETAVVTSGLPRTSVHAALPVVPDGWSAQEPLNLEVGRAMERAVREHAATPATVGVLNGQLHIGMTDEQLTVLATDEQARKASITNLATSLLSGSPAGATVSVTLRACSLLPGRGIRFLATGGIGGVHRGWSQHPDISVDLRALASTPVCVVCAGAKSILDVRATLELLETLAVPVVGYQTDTFPQFYSRGRSDVMTHTRVDNATEAAALCAAHWHTLHLMSSVLLVNPVAEEYAIEHSVLERAIALAEAKANDHRVSGPDRTPYLLAEVARQTEGETLRANVALLVANAALAADVAAV